jgi:hypothetical protein
VSLTEAEDTRPVAIEGIRSHLRLLQLEIED